MVSSCKKRARPSPYSFRITGGPGRFIKDEVQVSFKPQPKKKGIAHRSILPTFNPDRRHYTLTFRLPSSEPEKDEEVQRQHERRVIQSQIEIEDILYPKPRSRHKYCGICKDYYEDYKEHVEGDPHMEALRRSPFQRLIIEAADKIAEQNYDKKYEDDRSLESNTEEQLFKCISVETIIETRRIEYNIQ